MKRRRLGLESLDSRNMLTSLSGDADEPVEPTVAQAGQPTEDEVIVAYSEVIQENLESESPKPADSHEGAWRSISHNGISF